MGLGYCFCTVAATLSQRVVAQLPVRTPEVSIFDANAKLINLDAIIYHAKRFSCGGRNGSFRSENREHGETG